MILILLSVAKCVFSCWFSTTAFPSDLPLDLIYIWIVPSKMSLGSPPYTNSLLSMFQISYPYCHLGHLSKESAQVRGSFEQFATSLLFYGEGLLAPRPNSFLTGKSMNSPYKDNFVTSLCPTLYTCFSTMMYLHVYV
jgi:hypothetical protein